MQRNAMECNAINVEKKRKKRETLLPHFLTVKIGSITTVQYSKVPVRQGKFRKGKAEQQSSEKNSRAAAPPNEM